MTKSRAIAWVIFALKDTSEALSWRFQSATGAAGATNTTGEAGEASEASAIPSASTVLSILQVLAEVPPETELVDIHEDLTEDSATLVEQLRENVIDYLEGCHDRCEWPTLYNKVPYVPRLFSVSQEGEFSFDERVFRDFKELVTPGTPASSRTMETHDPMHIVLSSDDEAGAKTAGRSRAKSLDGSPGSSLLMKQLRISTSTEAAATVETPSTTPSLAAKRRHSDEDVSPLAKKSKNTVTSPPAARDLPLNFKPESTHNAERNLLDGGLLFTLQKKFQLGEYDAAFLVSKAREFQVTRDQVKAVAGEAIEYGVHVTNRFLVLLFQKLQLDQERVTALAQEDGWTNDDLFGFLAAVFHKKIAVV
ncbi:hypothetical protein GGF31_003470 [Allomyces arbusculus]|nr:hypothetical protein GGF31_003470 [Allomyces arbusculus]